MTLATDPFRIPEGFDPMRIVRDVTRETPLELAPGMSDDHEVLLKREDLGPNGSFKWRGALCACATLKANGVDTVTTASTGNHGAATAWAAVRLGMRAHVVVPAGASEVKCGQISALGAELHRDADSIDHAVRRALDLAAEQGGVMLEDGANEAQLLGTGTIGTELAEAGLGINVVLTPLACGALAGGMATQLAKLEPKPWVIGVQSTEFPRLGALWRGEPDPGPDAGTTFAGGLADTRIVEPAFSACKDHLDDVVSVDDNELAAAVRELHIDHGLLVEGAAAAPLAALRAHPEAVPAGRVVMIISGRNLDADVAEWILGGEAAEAQP